MTRRIALVFVGSLVTVNLLVAEVPKIISGSTEGAVWVAAEEVAPEGVIQWELVPEHARDDLERQLALVQEARRAGEKAEPNKPCLRTYFVHSAGKAPRTPLRSPQDLGAASELMVLGRVVGESTGLYRGIPATVFELAIEHYLGATAGEPPKPERVHFVTLGGEVPVGDDLLCYTRRRGDQRILAGTRVLLALDTLPDLSKDWLIDPADSELFFELPDGSVSMAVWYPKKDETFDELVASMQKAGEGWSTPPSGEPKGITAAGRSRRWEPSGSKLHCPSVRRRPGEGELGPVEARSSWR